MSFRDKFLDCINEVRRENEKIRKILVDSRTFNKFLNQYALYSTPEDLSEGTAQIYGYRVETDHFGTKSLDDFILFTDRRVIHSDMLEKNFVEDLDVEKLLDETNKKIESRDT